MADIKNYTLNFGSGRAPSALDFVFTKSAYTAACGGGSGRAPSALDFVFTKSACAEVQRDPARSDKVVYG